MPVYAESFLLESLTAHARSELENAVPQDIANMSQACASALSVDEQLFETTASWSTEHAQHSKLQELANMSQPHAAPNTLREQLWDAAAVASARKIRTKVYSEVLFVDLENLVAAGGFSHLEARLATIELRQAVDEVLARRAATQDATASDIRESTGLGITKEYGGLLPQGPCVLIKQPRVSVLWKPAGWTVSVGRNDFSGFPEASLADTGLSHKLPADKDLAAWLMRAFGKTNPIALDAKASHGLVHRLDKMTSGALLWASCYSGYYAARLQFASRHGLRKEYVCLCDGLLKPSQHLIALALRQIGRGEDPRRSVADAFSGRASSTLVLDAGHFTTPENSLASLVWVRLRTGRQHQIRAHLSHIGHALVGDATYGGSSCDWCPRMFLHASHLSLNIGDGDLKAEVPLPADLLDAASELAALDARSRVELRRSQVAEEQSTEKKGCQAPIFRSSAGLSCKWHAFTCIRRWWEQEAGGCGTLAA